MNAFVVLRIQDANGRGPWKPGFSHRWVEDRPDHDNLPPWFVEFGRVDKLALAGEHVGSGCRTMAQLRVYDFLLTQENCEPIRVLAKGLGHANINNTDKYLSFREDELNTAIRGVFDKQEGDA